MQRTGSIFGINNSNWYANGIDWIGDAIEAIGYHCGFDEIPIDLEVKNFRVAIPPNMESIDYIEHNGHRLPLGVDESDYGFVRRYNRIHENILNYDEMLSLGKLIDNLNALRELDPAVPGVLEQIENTLFQINVVLGTKYLAGNVQYWRHNFYNIESTTQYIKTSFDSGTIRVHSRMFKVDGEGLPLIMNTFNYKEAISWFLIYRLILGGYNHPTIKKWEEAYAMWEDDRGTGFSQRARAEAKMPSIDEMERFKNRWVSVKRDAFAGRVFI